MKLKLITLQTYLSKYMSDPAAPLFVVNNTTNLRDKSGNRFIPGHVHVSLSDERNRAVTVTIPSTFIPIDITLLVSRDTFLNSPRVKNMLAVGTIALADNEEALAFMKSQRAITELQRIREEFPGNSFGTIDLENQAYETDEVVTTASSDLSNLSGFVAEIVSILTEEADSVTEDMVDEFISQVSRRYVELTDEDKKALSEVNTKFSAFLETMED